MKKLIRITAVLLVLTCLFTLFASVAFAASRSSTKNVTNGYFFVETGKKFILNPTIKVQNTGSSKMFIIVENSSTGAIYKTVNALNPGKTATISLKPNTSYIVYWGGTYSTSARGTISAGRFIKSIC